MSRQQEQTAMIQQHQQQQFVAAGNTMAANVANATRQQDAGYLNESARLVLESVSNQLSRAIIMDAISEAKARQKTKIDRLLGAVVSKQEPAKLELLLRSVHSAPNQLHCPLCDGSGQLDLNGRTLIRLTLPLALEKDNLASDELGRLETLYDAPESERRSGVARILTRLSAQLGAVPRASKEPEASAADLESLRELLGEKRRRPSLEKLLADLRSERQKLDEYKKIQANKVVIVSGDSQTDPLDANERQSGTRSFIDTARGQLSSNIQRMKRMDTLKRRKLKREKQQGGNNTSFASTYSSELNSFSTININFAKVGSSMSGNSLGNLQDDDSLSATKQVGSNVLDRSTSNPIREETSDEEANNSGHEEIIETNGRPKFVQLAVDQSKPEGPKADNNTPRSNNYQSFRASLANLLNEAIQTRNRLSLINPFVNLSASNSPVKQKVASPRSSKERAGLDNRKQSSRSQSSSSGGGRKSPNKQQEGRTSNCSCLRSSESSQSLESVKE